MKKIQQTKDQFDKMETDFFVRRINEMNKAQKDSNLDKHLEVFEIKKQKQEEFLKKQKVTFIFKGKRRAGPKNIAGRSSQDLAQQTTTKYGIHGGLELKRARKSQEKLGNKKVSVDSGLEIPEERRVQIDSQD